MLLRVARLTLPLRPLSRTGHETRDWFRNLLSFTTIINPPLLCDHLVDLLIKVLHGHQRSKLAYLRSAVLAYRLRREASPRLRMSILPRRPPLSSISTAITMNTTTML